MRLSRRHFGAGLAALSLAPYSALAHRETKTHTSVVWKEAEQTLHVTHTFHRHDAATALSRAGIIDAPSLLTLKARAKLSLYTEDNFELKTLSGGLIPLELIGADYDSKSVFVFQQARMSAAPTGLSVNCRILQKLVPGQVNDIDINLGGPVRSARFKNGDGAKIILA